MPRCRDCGGHTVWDDGVGSAICTACGTLVDPTQSVLASHLDLPDSARQYNQLWDPSSSATLKSLRTGSGWDLAGQGKEARDRKNTYAMHEFIKSLSYSLSAPGLSPRATTLFTQAMAAGNYRWGRRAKLVAGSCVSIALREAKQADSLRDIAFLLNDSFLSLSRTFMSVIGHLKLALASADPALHFPSLQSHLSSVLDPSEPTSVLPNALVQLLRPLCLQTVTQTATALASLLARLGDASPVAHLPTAPTACGLYMLALEAEARTAFTHLAPLAQCLAARIDAGKGVVMARYKAAQDVAEQWARELPWLERYERRNGRARVAKRTVVARGLKDVLHFQEDIWRRRSAAARPQVALEEDPADHAESGSESDAPAGAKRPAVPGPSVAPRKRRKTRHALDQASLFLLNPLAASPPRKRAPLTPGTPARGSGDSSRPAQQPFTSYLLAASPSTMTLREPPTRLQLLAVERGGADEDAVGDDELFADGELDGLLRDEKEREQLRGLWQWDSDEEPEDERPRKKSKRTGKGAADAPAKGSKRVNMDALAKLLGGDSIDKEDDDGDNEEEDDDGSPYNSPERVTADGGEVVLEEWRPLSPGAQVSFDAGGQYDEEYD